MYTKKVISHRLDIFSQRTTFHGFCEMKESKLWPQKLFWVIIMLCCTGMLAFSVSMQLIQWVKAGTLTKAVKLPSDEKYKFPPILLALDNWTWLDTFKLEQLGISYEEIVLATGYVASDQEYYSNKPVDESKKELWKKIQHLGLSGLYEFFSMVAWDTFDGNGNGNVVFKLPDTHIFYYQLNTSSANKQVFSKTWTYQFKFNFSAYLENMAKNSQFFKHDQTMKEPPTFFNPDTSQSMHMQAGYKHTINVDCRVYRQLHNCRKDMDHNPIYYPRGCQTDCEIQVNNSHMATSCTDFLPHYHDDTIQLSESYANGSVTLCHQGVLVNGSHLEGQENTIYRHMTVTENQQRLAEVAACQNQCLPKCERWSMVWGVMTSQLSNVDENRNISRVSVIFPDGESLVITEEMEGYAWHDMISDVGGLLGLWMGGSIMSLFQIVHLCCWAGKRTNGPTAPVTGVVRRGRSF